METFFADFIDRLALMHADYRSAMDGLTSEQLDWAPGADMNSLCVLAVHVTAAERFWIGIAIDDVTQRDRPAEFRASGYELEDLLSRFDANIAFYKSAFASQTMDRFGEQVDLTFPDRRIRCSRGWALLRALDHTGEHLGHAGLTRQLLDRR